MSNLAIEMASKPFQAGTTTLSETDLKWLAFVKANPDCVSDNSLKYMRKRESHFIEPAAKVPKFSTSKLKVLIQMMNGQLGYRRSLGQRKLGVKSFDVDIDYFRNSMKAVLSHVLLLRYCSYTEKGYETNKAEIKHIVCLTADICMSALYAKLRHVNKFFGLNASCYTSDRSFTKDIELPLPFAMAIEDFDVFQTHCLAQNIFMVPTFPQGTLYEGREKSVCPVYEYLSYIPTLKKHGIPFKHIDPKRKVGTASSHVAWCTFKVDNVGRHSNLVCTLPPSHYTDHGAILRSVFLDASESHECKDIIKFPSEPLDYCTRMKDMTPGYNARMFFALIHGPEEEWSSRGQCMF